MSARPHSPARHRGRRKGHGKGNTDQSTPQSGMGRGMPRYLARPRASEADVSSSSEREARSGDVQQVSEQPVATTMGRAAAQAMQTSDDTGRPLGDGERSATEKRLGTDFSDVRVTENSDLAASFGANAMTFGDAIHFAPGRGVTSDLLGHELTHVAQQRRFGAEAAQFDLGVNAVVEDNGMGLMGIGRATGSYTKNGVTQIGLHTKIAFFPHASSPYANRIGLIQTADVEDIDTPGQPDSKWPGEEEDRELTMTTEGTFIDKLHKNIKKGGKADPVYGSEFGHDLNDPKQNNHFGWNRSATDRSSAQLWDFPKSNGESRFEFETVAMGLDSRVVYGAIRWGFDTDGTRGTSNEWVDIPKITTSGGDETYQSKTFDEALRNYRDFFVHEPIIVYYGSNGGIPTGRELGKLSDAASYMTDNPKVGITLTASEDMRGGSEAGNQPPALNCMNAVHLQLLNLGVAWDRIKRDETGAKASRAQGSSDPALANSEGSFQANRQVTVTFEKVSD